MLADSLRGGGAAGLSRSVVGRGLRVTERKAGETAAEAGAVTLQELENHVAAHRQAGEDELLVRRDRSFDLLREVVGEERHRVTRHGGPAGDPAAAEVESKNFQGRGEVAELLGEREPEPPVEGVPVDGDDIHAEILPGRTRRSGISTELCAHGV